MKSPIATYRQALLLALLLLGIPQYSWASSRAGIEIDFGTFRLEIYYSVALDYSDGGADALKDPRRALCSLASLIQVNGSKFSKINATIRMELLELKGATGTFLRITEDPDEKAVLLWKGPIAPDAVRDMTERLCRRFPVACANPPLQSVTLYTCGSGACPGQIRAGAFPSTTLDQGFALMPTGEPPVGEEKVECKSMSRYFQMLP